MKGKRSKVTESTLDKHYKETEPYKPETFKDLLKYLRKVARETKKNPIHKLSVWAFADESQDHHVIHEPRNMDEMVGAMMDASVMGYSLWYVYKMNQTTMDGLPCSKVGLVMHKKDNYETNVGPELMDVLMKFQWFKRN